MSTRDEIIAAAVNELRDRDEASFRITTVATTAGCATSVLYHHFGSRDGVIDAALIELITEETDTARALLESFAEAAVNTRDAVELFAEYARLSHSSGRRADRVRRTRLLGAAQTRPAVLSAYREFEARNALAHQNLVTTLQARGLLRAELDSASVGLLLRTLDYGWVLDDVNLIPGVAFDEWIELVRVIAGALVAPTDYLERDSAD